MVYILHIVAELPNRMKEGPNLWVVLLRGRGSCNWALFNPLITVGAERRESRLNTYVDGRGSSCMPLHECTVDGTILEYLTLGVV